MERRDAADLVKEFKKLNQNLSSIDKSLGNLVKHLKGSDEETYPSAVE